jgi:hypothetical protein
MVLPEKKPVSMTKQQQQAPPRKHLLLQSSIKLLGTNLHHYSGSSPLKKRADSLNIGEESAELIAESDTNRDVEPVARVEPCEM